MPARWRSASAASTDGITPSRSTYASACVAVEIVTIGSRNSNSAAGAVNESQIVNSARFVVHRVLMSLAWLMITERVTRSGRVNACGSMPAARSAIAVMRWPIACSLAARKSVSSRSRSPGKPYTVAIAG